MPSKCDTDINRIKAFDTLRFLAMMMVMIAHCGVIDIGGGAWSVSFYFVLSGYLKYKPLDSREKIFLKMKWNLKHLYKKNYRLAFATMLIDLPIQYGLGVIGYNFKSLAGVLTSFLLINSWFYDLPRLNSVTWFLSSLAFCYFLSPLFCLCISKLKSKRKSLISLILICIIVENIIEISLLGHKQAIFFTYYFPPTRVLDFVGGMCLKCLLDSCLNLDVKKVNLLQIVSLLATISIQFFFPYIFVNVRPLLALWLPLSLFVVFAFSMNGDTLLSKKLSTPPRFWNAWGA